MNCRYKGPLVDRIKTRWQHGHSVCVKAPAKEDSGGSSQEPAGVTVPQPLLRLDPDLAATSKVQWQEEVKAAEIF
jgi:hypothetical protein